MLVRLFLAFVTSDHRLLSGDEDLPKAGAPAHVVPASLVVVLDLLVTQCEFLPEQGVTGHFFEVVTCLGQPNKVRHFQLTKDHE